MTLQTSQNYACIAQARTAPKQRREADDAVAVPEVGANHGGDGDDGEADGQVEAAEARAQAGLASLGANTRIAHHFSSEMLEKITSFSTADRTQAFVKDLMKSELMQPGELPAEKDMDDHELPPLVLPAMRVHELKALDEASATSDDDQSMKR